MYHNLLSKKVAETINIPCKKICQKIDPPAPVKHEVCSIRTILNSLNLSLLGKKKSATPFLVLFLQSICYQSLSERGSRKISLPIMQQPQAAIKQAIWGMESLYSVHAAPQHKTLILQSGYLHISIPQFNFSIMPCSIQSLVR